MVRPYAEMTILTPRNWWIATIAARYHRRGKVPDIYGILFDHTKHRAFWKWCLDQADQKLEQERQNRMKRFVEMGL